MTAISAQALRDVLDAHVIGTTWRQCMAQVGAKENTAFTWMAQSRDAEKRGDTSSVFYVDWPEGSEPEYWHRLIVRARARRAMVLESQMVSEAIHGHEEVVIVDGKIAWRENPLYVGWSDDDMRDVLGADPVRDRILRDKDEMPVPLTRKVVMAATSRNMILQGTMPAVYGQHVNVDARHHHVVRHMGENRKPPVKLDEQMGIDELRKLAALPPATPADRVSILPAEDSPLRPQVSYARRPLPQPSPDDNPRGVKAQPLDRCDSGRDYAGNGRPAGGFSVRR